MIDFTGQLGCYGTKITVHHISNIVCARYGVVRILKAIDMARFRSFSRSLLSSPFCLVSVTPTVSSLFNKLILFLACL